MKRAAIFTTLVVLLSGAATHAAERTLTVFAASSLTEVLEKVGSAYTKNTGVPVRFSFAASSALARQVESGAPADAFVSADQDWMNYLAQRNLIQPGTRTNIVTNSLVLVAPADSKVQLKIAPRFALAQVLGRNGRISMGEPL